ncbi:MAG: hypothetical protein ACJAVV_001976 [Alphaproteobacteria bacterium]|jgi:hypothetical protein
MNPLDQLADITAPASVSLWPLAWGYWLLIVLSLALLIWGTVSLLKFRKKRHEKYKAVAALSSIDSHSPYFAHKVQLVMKTLCAHYLPYAASKTLYGNAWRSLLLSVYKGKQIAELDQAITMLQKRLYAKAAGNEQTSVPSDSENQETANIEQNQQILIAMKDLVNTSFPCKTKSAEPMSLVTQVLSPQKATHV